MKIFSLANKLERILTKYLQCHYGNFGVKANGNLDNYDWKSPVNFALGCKYGESEKNSKLKEEIDFLGGNILKGQNMEDLIENYEYYGYNSQEEVYSYIKETINQLEEILNKTLND